MQLFANQNFRNSFYDGAFAHMFATLTGGVFLTGFALYLGMNELMIGLLAAAPFLVTGLQIPVSHVLSKRGRRKNIAYFGAVAARIVWVPVLCVGIMPVLLHLTAGSFWAGINLCTNNLLLSIAPKQNRAFFLSAHNTISALGAAISPILAGTFLKSLGVEVRFIFLEVLPLHCVFLCRVFLGS